MTTIQALLALVLAFGTAGAAASQPPLRLAGIFGDQMVVQRNASVPVWGWAEPGEEVTVAFGGHTKSAAADANGKWRVQLDAMPASAEPREMIVATKGSSITLRGVLVGEVWLAGGQSNMRFPLSAAHNADEEIPKASDPQLRVFTVAFKAAAERQDTVSGAWTPTTPSTAKEFSAVAYFFAKELRQALGCPIGVIAAPWGGTPIETWISLESLKKDPSLTRTLGNWDLAVAQYRKALADPNLAGDYQDALASWKKEVEPAFNEATKAYNADKATGRPVGDPPTPARPEPQNPDPMGMPSPSRRPQTPTVSFNGMIAPLAPYAVRGVIWYQGEANGSAGIEYRVLFPRLIQDWRAQWGVDFPFLFVQLPANGADPVPVAEKGWPWTREAQAMALAQPRTGMAVAIDLGDPNNVHPTGKIEVGRRLALVARRQVYGQKVAASGPVYTGFAIEGGKVRVRFNDAGGGLTPGQAPWRAPGVEPLPSDRLVGFYVAGEDRRWVDASASIEGDTVLVWSPDVPAPVAVRYAWANSPRCNLYNREGLPAAPFRTDDWDSPTGVRK